MSVEEIRAQRRDLGEVEEAEEGYGKEQSPDIEIGENGTLELDAIAPDTTTTTTTTTDEKPKDSQEAKDQLLSHPPVGSLADLTISPPGSPVPTSPVTTSIDGRVRSPGPGARPATHSRSNEAYLQTVLKRRASNSADDFAEKMRTAAVMLAQLNQQQNAQQAAGANGTARSSTQSRSAIKAKANSVEDIRAKIIKEMMALEEQRMQRMRVEGVSSGVGGGGGEGAGSEMLEDERKVMANVATDDPSGKLDFEVF